MSTLFPDPVTGKTTTETTSGIGAIADNTTFKTVAGRIGSCWATAGLTAIGNYTIGQTLGMIVGFATQPQCMAAVIATIADLVFWLAAILMTIIVGLFSYSYEMLVAGMGSIINGQASGSIVAAWQMIRDLVNIGIIGGLIAVAIGTILQVEKYSANKLLARLIIAAVLVNFSYFFTGAIIDSSNYLAVQMYQNVVCSSPTDCGSASLTAKFEALRVDADKSWGDVAETLFPWAGAKVSVKDMVQSLGGLICILIAIFVFLSAFALIMGRFVVLVFLLISSPLGIAGSAIPGLSGNKFISEWWGTLLSQAFFAPVLFLLIGLSLRIAQGTATAFKAIPASSTSLGASVGGLVSYLLAAVFMLIALRIAKQMSQAGATYFGDIYKGADKLAGWMPGLYKYAGRTIATESLGRAGSAFGDYYRDSLAPRLRLDRFPVLEMLDRRLQQGAGALASAKFGGTTSYAETKQQRQERSATLDIKARALQQEQEAQAAARVGDARATAAATEIAKGEREHVADEEADDVSGGGTPAGSPPPATIAPGSGGEGGGSGGSVAEPSAGATGGNAPSGIPEGYERFTPNEQTGTDKSAGGSLSGPAYGPDVAPLETEPEYSSTEDRAEADRLGRIELERHRAEFADENGKIVGRETVGDVMRRTGLRPAHFLKKDKDGKWVAKTPDELHREFGSRVTLEATDISGIPKFGPDGKPQRETVEEMVGRLSPNGRRGIIRIRKKS